MVTADAKWQANTLKIKRILLLLVSVRSVIVKYTIADHTPSFLMLHWKQHFLWKVCRSLYIELWSVVSRCIYVCMFVFKITHKVANGFWRKLWIILIKQEIKKRASLFEEIRKILGEQCPPPPLPRLRPWYYDK